MSRSVVRKLSLFVILIIPATACASTRNMGRAPRLSIERGEMRGFDKVSRAVVLRTAAGEEPLRVTSATILREGAHVIQSDDLWMFVGHSAKARVVRSNGKQVLDNMIISPEHVTRGRLVSYDPRSRQLVLDGAGGQLALTLTPSSWVLAAPALIDPGQLQRFVGHLAKVTTSMADGHVISVRVGPKT